MKKILDYLYIFSKLSTSFILLLGILFFAYFFYISFNSQEKKDNKQSEFINKLNENSKQLLTLSKKIQTTDSELSEIIEILKINNSENNTKEISLLSKKIKELSLEFETIYQSLKETQISEFDNKKDDIKNLSSEFIINKNKSEISDLIIFKFENSLDFSEDLSILQNLNSNNNQHIFEKISLVNSKNYRGNIFLKDLFAQELDAFLKANIDKNAKSFVKNSIMKFIIIEPSKKNIIKNDEVNFLNEINFLLEQKDYKESYKKMTNINNYQVFFNDTLSQLSIVIEFKELIQKVS